MKKFDSKLEEFKMKKGLSLLLATMMFASASTSLAYNDIDGLNAETKAAIDKMAELKIMTGYEDGTFAPDGAITRAEFAKVAVAAFNAKNPGMSTGGKSYTYSDLVAGAWYTYDISNATALGLMQGDAAGTFRPNAAVSEPEVVTVLMRILGYEDLEGTWPLNYLGMAQEIGLIDGIEATNTDNMTSAQKEEVNVKYSASRATVAVLVEKMLTLESNVEVPKEEVAGKYGYVYKVAGEKVSVKGFDDSNVTYTLGSNVKTPAVGDMIYFAADSKEITEIKTTDVVEEKEMSATIDGDKIKFSKGTYKFAYDVKVLDVNGSGASLVDIADVMAGGYVSAVRSTSAYANIQYVLNNGEVQFLLIGSYANSSDLNFAYAESFGNVANGETEVTFHGLGSYLWDDKVEQKEGALYAYKLDGNMADAYLVNVENADTSAKFAMGEVDYVGDINGLENGKNFVIGKDTVIMRVELADESHTSADFENWEIGDVKYETKVKKGDDLVVRYIEDGDSVDIEASFIIIVG